MICALSLLQLIELSTAGAESKTAAAAVMKRCFPMEAIVAGPRASVQPMLPFGMFGRCLLLAISAATAMACSHREQIAPPREPRQETLASQREPAARAEVQVGDATWYGGKLAGRRTASGERFDPRQMTAAHRTLPLGTWVEVTRADTGARVRVRINDRGPFGHEERVIDLSRAAADKLGIRKAGVARVEVRVVSGP
jgi:rare lipoprotein A